MKNIFWTLMLLWIGLLNGSAGESIIFRFSAGTIDNRELKSKMEDDISALLSEINQAAVKNSQLNLTNINMEDEAKRRLMSLWDESIHFMCEKSTNISKCLNDFQGFQIRNIPVTIQSNDSIYTGLRDRELTISLNRNGQITGVRLSLESYENVNTIMFSPGGVADIRQRREVLKWIEDYVSYYAERNIDALNKLYGDETLVITGSLVDITTNDENDNAYYFPKGKVEYKLSSRVQYINNIAKIFCRKDNVHIKVDQLSLMMHGAVQNIYGLTLHQKFEHSSLNDEGWLFLLWNFNDPEKPQIHVRTWQPDQVVAKDGVYTLDDFFIP